MLCAGYELAMYLLSLKKPMLIVCGKGNNGGDGWAAAHFLLEHNVTLVVVSLVEISQLKKEAKSMFDLFIASKNKLESNTSSYQIVSSVEDVTQVLTEFQPTIIIDAIFGVGLNRPISGLAQETIERINNYQKSSPHCQVVAVDIPSGLSANGQPLGKSVINAHTTVSFSFLKIAHLDDSGINFCGQVICKDIGLKLPDNFLATAYGITAVNQPSEVLEKTNRAAHKGNFPHVAILEGASETRGASLLSARAAMRTGASLVTLLTNKFGETTASDMPELMHKKIQIPLPENALKHFSALVLGPGLGHDQQQLKTAMLLLKIALEEQLSIVVDADALPLLRDLKNNYSTQSIIVATPHPGEAARLLGISTADLQKNRLDAVKKLTELPFCPNATLIWVLKGACPIVLQKGKTPVVLEGGISALAIGGSGDILSGIVAASLGLISDPFDATIFACSAHLAAGRLLSKKFSRGHLASEIADLVPEIIYKNAPEKIYEK